MQKIPSCNDSFPGATGPRGSPPTVLTIAGFDPSSGAGVTADLKVFAAHDLYGLACATALTVQSTQGVRRSQPVQSELIAETLACLSDDVAIAGVKIGMLGSRAAIESIAHWLAPLRAASPDLPVVLDPVLRASSGTALLPLEAVDALRTELLPLVSVVTPNLPEAALLAGAPPCETRSCVPNMARLLQTQTAGAVLITGGHLQGASTPEDYLLQAGADQGAWFPGEWVRTRATHGTGCALSSALLCGLVQGLPLGPAVRAAKRYVETAMRAAYPVGRGSGPMHHLFACDAVEAPRAPGTSEETGQTRSLGRGHA